MRALSRAELRQGTVGEMLDKSGREVFDLIRWFGERGKLFNVHFRSYSRGGGGRKLSFNGNLSGGRATWIVWRSLKTYADDLSCQYMIMPDHVPRISDATPKTPPSLLPMAILQPMFARCWRVIGGSGTTSRANGEKKSQAIARLVAGKMFN